MERGTPNSLSRRFSFLSCSIYKNLSNVWVLAHNEFRVCARLSRTKFLVALTLIVCAWYFVVVTLSHMQTSGVAPMFGVISPRYLASLLGGSFLSLFCFVISILAFDMYSRDEKSYINEVISTKPVGDLQYFLGRLFGIFMLMGIPLVSVVALGVGYGLISEIFTIPFGEPIEPWSIVSLLVLDVIPNFVFFGGLALFLASFIRPRFLALLLSVFCVYGWLWLTSRLPLTISTPLHTVTGNVIFSSDLIPTLSTSEIVLNRVALMLMGFGFLYWSSLLYRRNVSSRSEQRMNGVFSFTAGVFFIFVMFAAQFLEHRQISGWKQWHDAHFDVITFPDVHHIEGDIDIDPGSSILLDLRMMVSISGDDVVKFVLFSFNPSYRIDQLSIEGEAITDYQFNRGLLKIPRTHFATKNSILQLKAMGRPNAKFAYLDSVERLSKIFGPEVRQLRYLGTENYIFRSNFVVLMPGIKWYPVAGTATNEDSWGKRPRDFFTIDLNVSVPRNWVVTGPAKREVVSHEERTIFSFKTTNPIPHLALVTSRFEQLSDHIKGIHFEVLYSGAHRRTFESLTGTGQKIRDRIIGLLDDIRDTGFDYPYSVFSLVQVPASLRIYGGGNKMDTVLGMPGFLMFPETTLPTLHLDSLHNSDDFKRKERERWTDVRWNELKIARLAQYFGNALYAGSHSSHLSRSILSDQVSASGPNAELLNTILEQIVQLMFAKNEISFDPDLALDLEILDLTYIEPLKIFNMGKHTHSIDRLEQLYRLSAARENKLTGDEVFDVVESVSLADYNSIGNFNMLENRALRLRALAVSKLLIDLNSTNSLTSTLTELIHKFRGRNFTYDEFIEVAQSRGVTIEKPITDMLHSLRLPGFIASVLSKTHEDVEEDSSFQATLLLENSEETSGYCMLIPINQTVDLIDYSYVRTGEPLFLEKNQSLEVVIESNSPIIDVVIEPYLSLNRSVLRLNITSMEELKNMPHQYRGRPSVVSIREIQSNPSDEDQSVIIDDLDSGFSIIDSSDLWSLQPLTVLVRKLAGKSIDAQIRGLPAFQFDRDFVQKDTWERKSDTTAYGKYWRTLTLNRDGRGETFAKFIASLPSLGNWRLDYYLPEGNFTRVRRYQSRTSISDSDGSLRKGLANFDVHINSNIITRSIDTSETKSGWHAVGEFTIEFPEVEVWVSNNTRGRVVFADAMRWSPIAASE